MPRTCHIHGVKGGCEHDRRISLLYRVVLDHMVRVHVGYCTTVSVYMYSDMYWYKIVHVKLQAPV